MREKSWKLLEKADFLRKTGRLLDEGYSLSQSIELVSLHQSETVKERISEIIKQLKGGDSLHAILEGFQFPSDVLCYLFIAEKDELSKGLIACGDMLAYRCQIKSRFYKTMRYPLFLLWLTFSMMILITVFLLPQFQSLYDSLDIPLPFLTTLIIQTTAILPYVFALFTLFPLMFFLTAAGKYRRQHPYRQIQLIMRFPFAGKMTSLYVTQYFSLQFGLLLARGRTANEALTVLAEQNHMLLFKEEAVRMKQSLNEGESLEKIIGEASFYTPELASVISHGQANGRLGKELLDYGRHLSEQFEEKMLNGFAVIQPASFACIGAVILLLFLAILLPMFQYIQGI